MAVDGPYALIFILWAKVTGTRESAGRLSTKGLVLLKLWYYNMNVSYVKRDLIYIVSCPPQRH